MTKFLPFVKTLIFYTFLALAIITPLIFTTQTTELYEVPKMFFVYFGSAVILFLTLVRFIIEKQIQIPKSWPVVAFAIFVAVQVFSTFFSIDKFTSVFGYPTRLNGGILSQLSYFVLFACALINLNFERSQKILLAIVTTALAVALLGIPGHFGRDPSCLILTGELTSSCWQTGFEPEKRIFSTLGQPNWLASFLVLTIPLTLAFGLRLESKFANIFLPISANLQFLALIFTASRSGLLGISLSLATFLAILGKQNIVKHKKSLIITFLAFLSLFLIFGTNLTNRTLETLSNNQTLKKDKLAESKLPQVPSLPGESAQIRLIVWRASFDIFKKWPILGSGPETFVSSYYMFRPQDHNATAEWDYFYNKAHNEFLNYLANTGALGFISFVVFLSLSIISVLSFSKNPQNLVAKASLASIFGYLLTIFFGFSTVATQTTFFLVLATAIAQSSNNSMFTFKPGWNKQMYTIPLLVFVTTIAFFTLTFFLRLLFADIFEKRAQSLSSNPNKEFASYQNAIKAHPSKNPYLLADFSYVLATYLDGLEKSDADKIAQMADSITRSAQSLSPKNYLIIQKNAKTYLLLTQYSPKFQDEAAKYAKTLVELAPTYPPAYLNAAKIQIILGQNEQALKSAQKAVELKDNYDEARQLLEQLRGQIIQ